MIPILRKCNTPYELYSIVIAFLFRGQETQIFYDSETHWDPYIYETRTPFINTHVTPFQKFQAETPAHSAPYDCHCISSTKNEISGSPDES